MTDLDNSTSSNSTSSNDSGFTMGNFRSMTSLIGIDSSAINMDDIVVTDGSVYIMIKMK